MKSDYYVYVYFRLDGSPCYVGKGRGQRWLHHEYKGKCTNWRLARIISRAGRQLPKIKVREGLSNDEARRTEIALIAAIGRGRRGPLVNMTDGGEGLDGTIMPKEIRRKIGLAHRGRKLTEEHRLNLSLARKAMFAARRAAGIETKLSDAHRAAIGNAHRGKAMSEDACKKMSRTKKGKPIPHRDRMSHRGYKQAPEHIQKRVEATLRTKAAIALATPRGFNPGFYPVYNPCALGRKCRYYGPTHGEPTMAEFTIIFAMCAFGLGLTIQSSAHQIADALNAVARAIRESHIK